MYVAGDDDPEYVPEHMRMASESASDDEAYMTDEDDDDEESDDEELANHGRIFIPLMGASMHAILTLYQAATPRVWVFFAIAATVQLTLQLAIGHMRRAIPETACMAAGGLRVARRSISERNATLSKLERVPKDPPPAEESVRQIVSSATACENPRHRNEVLSRSGQP